MDFEIIGAITEVRPSLLELGFVIADACDASMGRGDGENCAASRRYAS